MSPVRDKIKERILREGRITFAEFMDMALYYPGLGYYTSSRPRVGAEGDFYTSPATHPIFAALIALQLEQMWHLLGCPANFAVVETGAGKGLLAREVLDYLLHLSPALATSVNYLAMERDGVSLMQGSGASVGGGALPLRGVAGCFLSNEFLDALPCHRVKMSGGRLQEVYVTFRGDSFVEEVAAPSTPLLEQQLAEEGVTLPEGYTTEINLKVAQWVRDIAPALDRGFVLTFDYGYLAEELYSPERSQGTLMTYYHHTPGSDPYIRVGDQDITGHVDFTTVIQVGKKAGLRFLGLLRQQQFLLNLGLEAFLEALATKGLSHSDYMANRFSMLELVRPDGFGNFGVLIQSKGVEAVPLYCFTSDNDRVGALMAEKERLEVPLLRPEHTPLLQGKYPHSILPGSVGNHGHPGGLLHPQGDLP